MKFIERIKIGLSEKTASAQYFISPDAEFLEDHFPNTPMLPGLLMLEIAVQTAARWMTKNAGEKAGANFDLDVLDRLYVTRRVVPNETLYVEVKISDLAPGGKSAFVEARANVSGETAMRAKFHLRSPD